MKTLLASLALVALSTACGPLVSAELEDLSVCQTVPLPEVPGSSESVPLEAPLDLRFDLDELGSPSGTELVLHLQSVTLSADDGDLTFLDSAHVSLSRGEGEVTLVDAERAPNVSSEWTMSPAEKLDLMAFSKDGAVNLQGAIKGVLPRQAATLRVTSCFAAEARHEVTLSR